MQKKKITAFLLALAMVSAMALPVFAQEPNPQAETAASIAVVETATPETAATEKPEVDAEPAEDNVKEDAATYDAPPENGWYQEYPGGPWYWYENGVRQGTTGRGKEIYDPKSDAWYWLDAVQGGAMTTNKDVYQDSNGGKWVRYDANGHMVKGWDTNEKGTYYFDLVTGAMVKGMCTIDGIPCAFDTTTGIGLDKQWVNINGDKFWYEGGKRQGTTGRGKEIYDPASDAWYWLDSVKNGAMAVSKDVYQDSNGGKWVRYDANGHMIKGWDTNSQGTYYFDLITGAMAKGTVVIDGITCVFDYNTGILQSTNVDVTKYREIKRTNYYADGSVMNTLTTDYDAQGRLLKEQRRDKSGNLQVQDDFYYEYNGMLTKHTHREYGNDNYSYEYRYEYDKSNRFAKISVYRYNGGWYLYSYWTAKEWDSLGSVSKFWEYNGQNKVTCIVNLTSSGSRNRYTKMTIVNSSNKTVRTDTWSYDSNGHLAGWTNSGNSNGYSNVLRLSSDNNIGAGNPLFDRHCGKFVTDDKITSASIKFQNDEVVEIRQNNQPPIIMLTAKGETYDKVLGLELGADDYIVKPFEAKEVTARIKAVLRRCGSKDEENKGVYDFDNLHLDMNRYELKVKGKVVDAPPKELELLACLAGHPNRVYTRDQLLDEVWGFEYYGDSRTIDVHVKRLREKLEGASEQWNLKTVWGVGYKFEVKE